MKKLYVWSKDLVQARGALVTVGLNKEEISVITEDELLLKLLKAMYPGSFYTSEGENGNENLNQTV